MSQGMETRTCLSCGSVVPVDQGRPINIVIGEQVRMLEDLNKKLVAKKSAKPAVQEQIRRNCETIAKLVKSLVID